MTRLQYSTSPHYHPVHEDAACCCRSGLWPAQPLLPSNFECAAVGHGRLGAHGRLIGIKSSHARTQMKIAAFAALHDRSSKSEAEALISHRPDACASSLLLRSLALIYSLGSTSLRQPTNLHQLFSDLDLWVVSLTAHIPCARNTVVQSS